MHSDYYLPTLAHIGLDILTRFCPLTCSRCDITTTKQNNNFVVVIINVIIVILVIVIVVVIVIVTTTLSQWLFSGNPMAIQCAWNLYPNVHWNAAREILVGSQCVSNVLPMVFHGLPVCSNYANYHWIVIGTPLGDSISQCGSSCIPVYP